MEDSVRNVERGSKIITAVTQDTKLVLQVRTWLFIFANVALVYSANVNLQIYMPKMKPVNNTTLFGWINKLKNMYL